MFLEKHSRYFRKFEFLFAPRHKAAPHLPIIARPQSYSIADALQTCINAEKAVEVQPNGDVVELMEVQHRGDLGVLVVLIHRASPNAADPIYRKKARDAAAKKFTVRQAVKDADEEQSVSSHLVIAIGNDPKSVHGAALEEIPGISMAVVKRLISHALQDYQYDFLRGKKTEQTWSTFKPVGVKSETLENALQTGRVNFVTLTRPAKPDFVDADGLFKPENEVLRLRVIGDIDGGGWKNAFSNLFVKAKKNGWENVKVDVDLPDHRNRTISIDRDEEAKEILFVRSELAHFKTALPACSVDIVDEVVQKAAAIAKAI